MAGDLRAADGWQAFHRYRRRGQGGWCQAQVGDSPHHHHHWEGWGNCWGLARSSSPFTLTLGVWLAAVPHECWQGKLRHGSAWPGL